MPALLIAIAADAAKSAAPGVGLEGLDLTRYLIVCGALVAAIAALGFGFRKLVSGAVRARASRRTLEVLDVLPLGGKQRLSVVRCYDRTLVLGIGDKELVLLAEIDRDAAELVPAPRAVAPVPRAGAPAPRASAPAADFAGLLRGLAPRGGAVDAAARKSATRAPASREDLFA